jgi:hypothetical protein
MKTAALAKVESSPPIALADLTVPQLAESFAMLGQLASEHDNSHTIARLLQGFVLSEIKRKLPHGEFGKWIKKNFPKSQDAAGRYMLASRDFAEKLSDPKFRKRAEFGPKTAVDLLRSDLKATLERLDKVRLDLAHPLVRAAAVYAKGRSFNQILLELGETRGGDNTPRDESGNRLANRRRTKVEIEQEKFEKDARDACGVVAAKLEALLDLSGPHKQTAWEILDEETLPGFKQLLYRSYQGVLDLEKRRTAARRYGKR